MQAKTGAFQRVMGQIGWGMLSLLGIRGLDRRRYARGESNRRKTPRVETRNLLKITSIDGKPVNYLFNLVDISERGFRFKNFHSFRSGCEVQGVVNVREFNHQIPMDARIVWSQPITLKVVWTDKPSGERAHHTRHTGAEIVSIADSDRYVLNGFISHKMQSEWAEQ